MEQITKKGPQRGHYDCARLEVTKMACRCTNAVMSPAVIC